MFITKFDVTYRTGDFKYSGDSCRKDFKVLGFWKKGPNGKRFGLENQKFDLFLVVRLLPPYKMLCQHFEHTPCLIDNHLTLGMVHQF